MQRLDWLSIWRLVFSNPFQLTSHRQEDTETGRWRKRGRQTIKHTQTQEHTNTRTHMQTHTGFVFVCCRTTAARVETHCFRASCEQGRRCVLQSNQRIDQGLPSSSPHVQQESGGGVGAMHARSPCRQINRRAHVLKHAAHTHTPVLYLANTIRLLQLLDLVHKDFVAFWLPWVTQDPHTASSLRHELDVAQTRVRGNVYVCACVCMCVCLCLCMCHML